MVDVVSRKTRSKMMSAIRGRDTRPEMIIRRALHALGFRYRLHARQLPGSPDLVFPKYKAVVFVHGCFWHRHPGCKFATTPSTREEFWQRKFAGNVARDARVQDELQQLGWRVAVVWECSLKKGRKESTVNSLANWLTSEQSTFYTDATS